MICSSFHKTYTIAISLTEVLFSGDEITPATHSKLRTSEIGFLGLKKDGHWKIYY